MRRMRLAGLVLAWFALVVFSFAVEARSDVFDLDSAPLQGTVVTGTASDDQMTMTGLGSTVIALESLGGNDAITIEAGTVSGTGSGLTYSIDAGEDDDTLTISGGEIGGSLGAPGTTPDVTGWDGNDQFLISGGLFHGIVGGGLGNDVFDISDDAQITGALSGDEGDDIIRITDDTTVVGGPAITGDVAGADGVDTIEISGDAAIAGAVTGGNGVDTITVTENATVGGGIDAGAEADRVNVSGAAAITGNVAGGDGADTINVFGTSTVSADVNGDADDDVIDIAGAATVSGNVNGGAGGDAISVSSTANVNGNIDGGAGGDTITLSGSGTIGGHVIGGTGTDDLIFHAEAAQTFSFANEIQQIETIEKTGEGQWTLSNANIGTVDNLTVNTNGGTLVLGGSLVVNQNVTVRSGGTLTANGTLDAGNVMLSGGTLNTAAALTVTDEIDISSGTLTAASTVTTGDIIVRSGTFTSTGLLRAVQTVVGPVVTGGNVTVTGGTLNANGGMQAETNVLVSAGALNLGDSSSVAGTTAVSGGALNLAANRTLAATGAVGVSGGGLLAVDTGATLSAGASINVTGGTVTLANGATLDCSDTIVGAGGTVSGAGTIDGGAGIGALVVRNCGMLDGLTLDQVDVTFDNGATTNNVTMQDANSVTATGGQTVTNTNITATITNTLEVNQATTMTGNGAYDVGTNMTISGGSTVSGANAFTVQNNLTVQGQGSTLNVTNNEVVQVVGGNFTLATGASTEGQFQLQLGANGTVQNGATLGGDLTITTVGTLTFNQGSTLAAGNSIGRQDFSGNTTWNQPNIQVEFGSGVNDVYAINAGTLTVNGGTVHAQPLSGFLPLGTESYDFLVENGGTISVNQPLTVLQNSPILTYALRYTGPPGNYILDVFRNQYEPNVSTPNEKIIGAVLDSQVPIAVGDFRDVLSNLDLLPNTTELEDAVDAISPEPYASLGAINIAAADAFIDRTIDRMLNLSDGLDSACLDPANSVRVNGCNFWAHSLGAWENQDTVDTRFGYTSDIYGVVLGLDSRAENLAWGVTAGYADQQVHFDSTDARDNAVYFHTSTYASLKDCGRFLNFGAAYTRAWNNMHRHMVFTDIDRTADSDVDTNMGSAFMQGGWAFLFGGAWTLTPMAGVRYTHAGVGPVNERDANSLNLNVNRFGRDSCSGELGGKISVALQPRLRAEAYAGLAHEFCDVANSVDAAFAGAAPRFTMSGVAFTRDSARVSLLLVGDLAPRITIYGSYNGRYRTSYENHAAAMGVAVRY